ncbi:MAG: energy transducer TonB [Rikenellaceae bacterium]|nr:energy transducer TonB [Rikenellaceae bacterium]MCL2691836.1 energy transducer TonB [Rikenellaceae bacterium]
MKAVKFFLIALSAILLCTCASTSKHKYEGEIFEISSPRLGEEMPKFRGDDWRTFRAWVGRNVIYPQDLQRSGAEGTVILSFVIERDGRLSNIQILNSSGYNSLDTQAVRTVRSSPRWEPGRQDGKPVRVQFVVPVIFVMPKIK